eukprot:8133223-Pyramimonas_sp.AAC.1
MPPKNSSISSSAAPTGRVIPDDEPDECRRWMNGFPRPLLAAARSAHYEQLKAHITSHMATPISAKFARTSRSYSVHFETVAQARDLHDYMTDNQMIWTDPRDQSMHEIRVRAGLPGD